MEGIVDSKSRRAFIIKTALFSLINLFAFLFFVIYASIRSSDIASSVFAAMSFAVILIDLLVYASSDYKGGYIMIAVTAVLFIISMAGSFLIGLSVFRNSMSIVGVIALAAIPLAAIIYAALCAFGKAGEGKWLTGNVRVKRIIIGICSAALIAFIIVAIITFSCSTPINTNTINLVTLFIMLSFIATAVIIRIVRLDSTVVPVPYKFLTLVIALLIAVTAQYTAIDAVAYKDDRANRAAFVNAFGQESLELKGGRGSAYSFADVFIGMSTDNYKVARDIVYYRGEGERQGVTLRYDMYYPTYEGAHKRVLLNLHGSGGDKDIGNYAHRNKYFASRGYVVFDIQYGDFNERDTGFRFELRNGDNFLYYIDSFFTYAVEHNDIGADFSNTFVTGVSMGGGYTCIWSISHDNKAEEKGITIRGILPIYPGDQTLAEGKFNYLNYIDIDSPPCLMIMGMGDVIVATHTPDTVGKAYEAAGNGFYAALKITYAGHGSDGLLSGRFNQSFTYYAERFMERFAV